MLLEQGRQSGNQLRGKRAAGNRRRPNHAERFLLRLRQRYTARLSRCVNGKNEHCVFSVSRAFSVIPSAARDPYSKNKLSGEIAYSTWTCWSKPSCQPSVFNPGI